MAVRRVKGVQKVDGNAEEKTLTVEFDPDVGSVNHIREAMIRIGHAAEEV